MGESAMRRFSLGIIAFLAGSLLLLALPAALGETPGGLSYVANPYTRSSTTIYTQRVNERTYLFLPSSANLSSLTFQWEGGKSMLLTAQGDVPSASREPLLIQSGKPFDLLHLFPDGPVDDTYPVLLTPDVEAAKTEAAQLFIMASGHIGSLYLTSSDPVEHGRAWMDSQQKIEALATTGSMVLLREDGSALYDGPLAQIRLRGNTTWGWADKKPYQIKLDYKANLLDSGDSWDADRTWLLLAEAFDATLLHNSITLDLGREIGLASTPEYRPVDLYYDGEYRGTYLVCEKVEVARGRLDILDYGKYIEKLYGKLVDMDFLPLGQGQDAYGNPYQYVEGIQTHMGPAGAYLLELDQYFYDKEKSWVSTKDGLRYVLHSPKYVSQADADYVSCFLQELLDTIANHGIHPVNGKTIEQYIDLPSFVRYFLIQEFAKTCDFWYTSTYFHLLQGEAKLFAGPLWDFDIAYAMRDTRPHEGGVDGYVPESGWFRDLMTLPVFQEAVQTYFRNEFLPLLQRILLGEETARGQALLSLEAYRRRIEPSRRMNYILWELGGHYNNINKDTLYPTYEENFDYFRNYLHGRTQWMTNDIAQWSGHEIQEVDLTLTYTNANIVEHAQAIVNVPYSNAHIIQITWDAEKDSQHPEQTLYNATLSLAAQKGCIFTDMPVVRVNGHPVDLTSHDTEHVTLSYSFFGPTFEPAFYDGIDYALVYQYDFFVKQNPEVVEECGTDEPEAMLEYFAYYGIGEGLRAISTFDVEAFIANYERILDRYYMLDVESCTLHYLENCYRENLLGIPEPVKPEPAF